MQVPPDSITFNHYNGTISLFSPHLPTPYDTQQRHRPGHITLVTAEEYKFIKRPSIQSIIANLPVDHVYLIGEGQSRDGKIKWQSVIWNAGDRWRAAQGLKERRSFHVTTSGQDSHELNKGIESVVNRLGVDKTIKQLEDLSVDGMHQVVLGCQEENQELRFALSIKMVTKHPQSYKGFLCLAQSTLDSKTRMLSLAQALKRNSSLLRRTVTELSEIQDCSFGPTIEQPERERLPTELVHHLLAPWPDAMYSEEAGRLHRKLWLHTTPPRESIKYLEYELPRNFSWIYPLRIAGMSTPRDEEDIDCLERMGITDVLSLNKEGPLPRQWFKLKRIKHHQVMLENYAAPICAEMDVIWERVAAGGVWLIHCGGGVGRAGTVIACLMPMLGREGNGNHKIWENEDHLELDMFNPATTVSTNPSNQTPLNSLQPNTKTLPDSKWVSHRGNGNDKSGGNNKSWGDEDEESLNMPILGSDEAIKLLRQARPKSIESDIQAQFVSKWVSHRWKLFSNPSPIIEPSSTLERDCIRGKPLNADNMDNVVLFLIGKPGSGKSFFSEMVTKRRIHNKPTIIISQDDCGSKEMCEKEISREWPAATLLIFDRCNPKSKDRKTWLKKVHRDRRAVAIYFDYTKELCRQRMDQRIGHPTIRAGRGTKALDEMDKTMEPPTLGEGFDTIVTIDSFLAAKALATKYLTPPILLRKFPRTPHLIDTGATADDDLLCDIFPSNGILEGKLTIEEKIDGANLGISLDSEFKLVVQNRSHLIHGTVSGQFKGLDEWIQEHSVALSRILLQDPAFPERYILYGEWCQAKHSIHYTRLDDRFLAFDLYDRVSDTDCARRVLTNLLKGSGICQVPFIKECESISKAEILEMIQGRSAFMANPGLEAGGKQDGDGRDKEARMEGIYIRFEDPKRLICEARGKIVRGDFIATDAKHWSKSKTIWNRVGESESV